MKIIILAVLMCLTITSFGQDSIRITSSGPTEVYIKTNLEKDVAYVKH